MSERESLVEALSPLQRAEARLWSIARLKAGWDGALARAEARALLDEIARLRRVTSAAPRPMPCAACGRQHETWQAYAECQRMAKT